VPPKDDDAREKQKKKRKKMQMKKKKEKIRCLCRQRVSEKGDADAACCGVAARQPCEAQGADVEPD
jgi:hypothetical protein